MICEIVKERKGEEEFLACSAVIASSSTRVVKSSKNWSMRHAHRQNQLSWQLLLLTLIITYLQSELCTSTILSEERHSIPNWLQNQFHTLKPFIHFLSMLGSLSQFNLIRNGWKERDESSPISDSPGEVALRYQNSSHLKGNVEVNHCT
jgi:hypothetical protein